ncbi:MAG: MFS transporter [Streptosporangiaceae bacterium]|nr:MFS transporter [Streptosporangiaceae bacterium]
MAVTVTAPPAGSAQASASAYSGAQRKAALVVAALAFIMDLVDATILTIALPTIQRTMHASDTAVHWMAAGYTLAFALLLMTGGRLGDVFGYRRLFLAGVGGFMLSSLLAGLAPSPDTLVAARLFQGAAAAMMVPQVLSVVQLLYKAEERTAVSGMLGGLSMLATTLAPIVTGLLIKANLAGLSWRPIFLINVPVCLAALPLAAKYLPGGRSGRRLRVDVFGTILAILAVGLLVFPLIQGSALGWPAWAYAMVAAAAPVAGMFAWWQRRQAACGGSPLVVPALFGHRSFSLGLAVSLLVTATIGCFALTFTLLVQLGSGFSAIHAVLTALFMTAGMVPAAGALSKKAIPVMGRWSLTVGAAVMAAGIAAAAVIAAQAGPHLSTWTLAPALFVMGAGMGLVFVPLLPFILSNVHPDDAGSASGVANAVQQISGALGIAAVGEVFFSQLTGPASYGHAFATTAILQVALLAASAAITLFMPRKIAPSAYQQHF